MNLNELDTLWEGENIDKNSLKYLCRKYSPQLVMEWVARGLTIGEENKQRLIKWYKERLTELGEKIIEKPKEIKDERLFKDEYGDYFADN